MAQGSVSSVNSGSSVGSASRQQFARGAMAYVLAGTDDTPVESLTGLYAEGTSSDATAQSNGVLGAHIDLYA